MKTYRKMGTLLAKKFLSNYIREKLNPQKLDEVQSALELFSYLLIMHEGTTESVLFDLMDPGLFPHTAVISALDAVPVSFVYGDRDWVDSTGSEVLITAKLSQHGSKARNCQLHIVQNASHLLHNDNPQELSRIIIGDLKGILRGQYQTKVQ